jgi:hypothetical protein
MQAQYAASARPVVAVRPIMLSTPGTLNDSLRHTHTHTHIAQMAVHTHA